MLLLGSTDYGQEMTGAQKLKKKHQRLENELESHEDKIRVGRLENGVITGQTSMHVSVASLLQYCVMPILLYLHADLRAVCGLICGT